MPRYIVERDVDIASFTPEQVMEAGRLAAQVAQEMPGVTWVKSYISEAEGKIYCEFEAPGVEEIYEHSRRSGLPVLRISTVSAEVNPSMFL